MALELPYILGNGPDQAAISLYGFLQQNVLFDALSNKLPGIKGTPLEFLYDTTTLFSMIGMIVLFFSPSLWKPKYLVSWIFLFIAVYIGGSTGPEFSYNLNRADHVEYLNYSVDNNGLACKVEDKKYGTCGKLPYGDNMTQSIRKKLGLDNPTSGASAANTPLNKESKGPKINIVDGQVGSLKVQGFLPQVYILYASNRFRISLEESLYTLNAREFKTRKKNLNRILLAQNPNPQLSPWTMSYEELCKDRIGIPTNIAAGMTEKELSAASSTLGSALTRPFQTRDLMSIVEKSRQLADKNPYIVPPEIDLLNPALIESLKSAGPSSVSKVERDVKNYFAGEEEQRKMMHYYTINGNQKITTKTPMVYNETYTGNRGVITDRFSDIHTARTNTDIEAYDKGRQTFEKAFGSATATLVLPSYNVSKTKLEDSEYDCSWSSPATCSKGLVVMSNNDVGAKYVAVKNCGDLLREMSPYVHKSLELDNKDFENQVNKMEQANKACEASQQKINGPDGGVNICWKQTQTEKMIAQQQYLNNLDTAKKNCEGNPDCNIEQTLDRINKSYISAAINNQVRDNNMIMTEYYNNQLNSLKKGLTGGAYEIGKALTSLFDGPLAGLKSIGEGFRAGAYSVILPIIKNILIAFILVMTPILFLLGLLVPQWAPGVILTSLITLLFLQMTDIVMVLVQTVLVSVEDAVSAAAKTSTSGDNDSYIAFMETIWGMAYMASFAITAFVMFAAGNTKQIMSKMAGLDGTVQSTADTIAREGWNLTKKGVGLAAPGLGNSIVSDTSAFNAVTGFAAGASNLLSGNSTNPLQEWSHSIQKQQLAGAAENQGIKDDLSLRVDRSTGALTSDMKADYNEAKALKDRYYKERDDNVDQDERNDEFTEQLNSQKDTVMKDRQASRNARNNRSNKEFRGDGDGDLAETLDVLLGSIESSAKNQGVSKRLIKDSTKRNKSGTVTEIKGLGSQLQEDIIGAVLNDLGYNKKGFDKSSAAGVKMREKAGNISTALAGEVLGNLKGKSKGQYSFGSSRSSMAANVANKLGNVSQKDAEKYLSKVLSGGATATARDRAKTSGISNQQKVMAAKEGYEIIGMDSSGKPRVRPLKS